MGPTILGILDFSQWNPVFLELELDRVPNMTLCSRNSIVELFHGEVGEVELEKLE